MLVWLDVRLFLVSAATAPLGIWALVRYRRRLEGHVATLRQRSADIGIFDYAHIPMLYVPFTMLLNMNVARESTEGYEKSVKVKGYPAFEKWGKNGNSEIVVLVGDRFIVKSDTRGLGEGSAKQIVEKLDLTGLATKGK